MEILAIMTTLFFCLRYSLMDEENLGSNILSQWKTIANLPCINHIAMMVHTVQILLKSSLELIFSFYSLSRWKFSWIPFSEGIWFRLEELGSPYRGNSLFASPINVSLLTYSYGFFTDVLNNLQRHPCDVQNTNLNIWYIL